MSRELQRGLSTHDENQEAPLGEEVIFVNRVAKVVKGGRRFSFTAVVAVGDYQSRVGLGIGKASEVASAIRKASEQARRNLTQVLVKGTTVPYEFKHHFCATTLLLRPAKVGHGLIAGGAARSILSLAGIKDITAKYIGSRNPINCARVAFEALKSIKVASPSIRESEADTGGTPED